MISVCISLVRSVPLSLSHSLSSSAPVLLSPCYLHWHFCISNSYPRHEFIDMPHCCCCCCTPHSSHCIWPNCFRSFYCIFDSVECIPIQRIRRFVCVCVCALHSYSYVSLVLVGLGSVGCSFHCGIFDALSTIWLLVLLTIFVFLIQVLCALVRILPIRPTDIRAMCASARDRVRKRHRTAMKMAIIYLVLFNFIVYMTIVGLPTRVSAPVR